MSLEAIWDNIAKLSATVPGVRAAYAARHSYKPDGTETIPTGWPASITATPIAIVHYDGTAFTAGNFEIQTHTFKVTVYTGADDRQAYSVLAPMFTGFINAFRPRLGLYQSATEAVVRGSSGFYQDVVPARAQGGTDEVYLAQDILIEAEEVIPRSDYAVGAAT